MRPSNLSIVPRASRAGGKGKLAHEKLPDSIRRRPVDPETVLELPAASDVRPAPDHLDHHAARIWEEEYAPLVVGMRVMTDADWGMLAVLCSYEAQRRELESYLAENGKWVQVTTTAGDVVDRARPQVRELHAVSKKVVEGFREFGMTPSSRPRAARVPDRDEEGGGSGGFFG